MHLQMGQGQHSPLGRRQALASCFPSALRLAGQPGASSPLQQPPAPRQGGQTRSPC